jgi:glutaredoxin-like protein NrdH
MPIVYTKPRCVQCTAVRRYLDDAGVPYAELDLTQPEQADTLDHFKSLGLASAPITAFREHAIPGFDPNALDALINDWKAA